LDISDVGITAMAYGGHVVANEVRTIAKEHAAATENMVTHPNDDIIFRKITVEDIVHSVVGTSVN